MVVVFNATPSASTQIVAATAGQQYRLDPEQSGGSDPVVRRSSFARDAGAFTVPGRTVAVFLRR